MSISARLRACTMLEYPRVSSLSDGEADQQRNHSSHAGRRADRTELKRLQRLLTQERSHREQQHSRAMAAEREVIITLACGAWAV